MKIPKPVENYSDNQGKEQPDKKSRLFVGAMRKTVGIRRSCLVCASNDQRLVAIIYTARGKGTDIDKVANGVIGPARAFRC